MLPGLHRAAGTAGNRRVLRGGSFNNTENNARSAYRKDNGPNNRNRNNGFRVGVSAAAHSSQLCAPAGNVARLRLGE